MNEQLSNFIKHNLTPNEVLQIQWLMELIQKKIPNNTFTLTDLHKVLNTK